MSLSNGVANVAAKSESVGTVGKVAFLRGAREIVEEKRAKSVRAYRVSDNVVLFQSAHFGALNEKRAALLDYGYVSAITIFRDVKVAENSTLKRLSGYAFCVRDDGAITNARKWRLTGAEIGIGGKRDAQFKLSSGGAFEFVGYDVAGVADTRCVYGSIPKQLQTDCSTYSNVGTSRYLVQDCRDFISLAVSQHNVESLNVATCAILRGLATELVALRKRHLEVSKTLRNVECRNANDFSVSLDEIEVTLNLELHAITSSIDAITSQVTELTFEANETVYSCESRIQELRELERLELLSYAAFDAIDDIEARATCEDVLSSLRDGLKTERALLQRLRVDARTSAKTLFAVESKARHAKLVARAGEKRAACPYKSAIKRAQMALNDARKRESAKLILKHSARLEELESIGYDGFMTIQADAAAAAAEIDANAPQFDRAVM